MLLIERFTTEYVVQEDRLRLSALSRSGDMLVLWLTQRLLNRLVPYLGTRLQAQSAASVPLALQQVQASLALQSARQDLQQTLVAPVQLPRDEVAAQAIRHVLVHAVDLTAAEAAFTLCFKDAQGQAHANLHLPVSALRQWLAIIHSQYVQAQWSLHGLPAWLQDTPEVPMFTCYGSSGLLH